MEPIVVINLRARIEHVVFGGRVDFAPEIEGVAGAWSMVSGT